MSTINQIIKKSRKNKTKKKKFKALSNCPQKKGICLKVYTMTPRKPNSAIRKVARLKLTNEKKVTAYIPGEGHTLQKHATVLIRAGNIKDLPGVSYKMIRGKYDLLGLSTRKNGRSKYGTKKSKKQKNNL